MIKATVIIDNQAWKREIRNPQQYINSKIKKIKNIPFFKNKKQEFTILLTEKNKMKKLNNSFRKKNKITDVLSFPLRGYFGNKNYIGDIAICFEFIKSRSLTSNFEDEINKMWVHGYLHLVGYDHKNNKEFNKMRRKEKLILSLINKH